MSWIIGAVGRCSVELLKKIEILSASKLTKYRDLNFYIAAGGNKKTCLFKTDNTSTGGFVTVGVGIKVFGKKDFMSVSDWTNDSIDIGYRNFDGHFVCVKWNQNEVKMFTDVLGLRDIYLAKLSNDCIVFSTRGDWLSKICQTGVNLKEFGSRWLLVNQLSPNSIFNNIERVSSGTNVSISRKSYDVTIQKYDWLPLIETGADYTEEVSNYFSELITFPNEDNQKISLSLSGGMDSRVILSYLLKTGNKNWYTHTFGSYNHPDSLIAQSISDDIGVEHEKINSELSQIDLYISELKEYVIQTNVNNAVSGYLQLRNYKNLIGRNEVIIDGGFGEIWRREFLNRLLVRGKNELINRNIQGIVPYLQIHRANIFTKEINREFLAGCLEQLEALINGLPKYKTIGLDNWIDLLAIKTRLSNYYSSAQIHLDDWVFSYMPFIQPSVLRNLFNVPLAQRKNGKFFRQIIRRNYNALGKYPLAKGNTTHPFTLNTLQARLWILANRKLRSKKFEDQTQMNLINSLSTFIQDTISSSIVKDCGLYDYPKLLRLSAAISNGTAGNIDIHELDWWLAFELFRQGITDPVM
ncbi:MAG: hypothetical protein WCZ90_00900 [Melioribacteraceae bacterium]